MAQLFEILALVSETTLQIAEGVSEAVKQRKQKNQISQKNLEKLLYEIKGRIVQDVVMKQSKHLHRWHERKITLAKTMIGFFKIQNNKLEPTEWIQLSTINKCQCQGEKVLNNKKFYLLSFEGQDRNSKKRKFKFGCDIPQKRDQWLKWLKKVAGIKQNL